MMRFHQQIIFIFILLALQGKSFSHARPVKEATVFTTKKVSAMKGVANFSFKKEILPNAVKVEASARIDGRKMSFKTTVKVSNSKKVSISSSEAAMASAGKRNGDERENWKDDFMAFSADYRSPKPHPPKNN